MERAFLSRPLRASPGEALRQALTLDHPPGQVLYRIGRDGDRETAAIVTSTAGLGNLVTRHAGCAGAFR